MPAAHKRDESFYHFAPFDPIKYVKQLESVGFTREQAEMQSETFFSIVQEQLVTKQDLKASEEATRRDIKELETSLRQTIKEIDAKTSIELEVVRRDIKELDTKTTLQSELLRRDLKIWLGGMLISLVVVFSAIVTLIPHLSNH